MDDLKKWRERKILDAVYAHRNVAEIEPHEGPDFLLRSRPGAQQFGVEVTEYYPSQSEARLRNISGYVEELLTGGDRKHKDDYHASASRIDTAITGGRGQGNVCTGLNERNATASECCEGVAQTITKKDRVHDSASGDLMHINLVLRDHSSMLSDRPAAEFCGLFCTPELRRAVSASRFREVYFVTEFEDGDGYVPLRLVTTLATMYLAIGFLDGSEHKDGLQTWDDFVRWFAQYLSTITAREVRIRESQDEVEVLHGDAGILIQGSRVVIRERADVPFPQSMAVATDADWDDRGVRSGMPDYEREHGFGTGLVYAVGTGAVLASAVAPRSGPRSP